MNDLLLELKLIIKKSSQMKVAVVSLTLLMCITGLFFIFDDAIAFSGSGPSGWVSFCGYDNTAGKPACVGAYCPGAYTFNSCTWTQSCVGGWQSVSYSNPPCSDECAASNVCQSGYHCEGETCISNPTPCDASVSCNVTNAEGKYCRKIEGFSWQWVSLAVVPCDRTHFCQTYECGTNTASPQRGYCGIDNNGTFNWINSGSASCPYSINVTRNRSAYQLTGSCVSNDTGCQEGTLHVDMSGPNAAAALQQMKWVRVYVPPAASGWNLYNEMILGSAHWTISGTVGTWKYWRTGGLVIPINATTCKLGGDCGPGSYQDFYTVGAYLGASDPFTINCTPACPGGCTWGGCGDGIQNTGEQCDLGILNNNCSSSTCSATCTTCGNVLTAVKAGTGMGSISSIPAGIDNCIGTCSYSYAPNTTVALTASPRADSTFIGWSDVNGECSGIQDCRVLMDKAKTVTATFDSVPVAGQCNSVWDGTTKPSNTDFNVITNLCSIPSTSDSDINLNATSTGWTWTCPGLNTGVSASCKAFKCVKVITWNGDCNASCGGGIESGNLHGEDCSDTLLTRGCKEQPCPPGYREVVPY